jgi:hypothetical protein
VTANLNGKLRSSLASEDFLSRWWDGSSLQQKAKSQQARKKTTAEFL